MNFKDQSAFYHAKDELLKADTLYEDREFPPPEIQGVTWLRPPEMETHPRITINPMILDVVKGNYETSSFVVALSIICQRKELIAKVFPAAQDFNSLYCGIFYFQFWSFGNWLIVDIDDRLPCYSSHKQLYGLRSNRKDEFFFSLIEKAYAKFKGGYHMLPECKPGDVLVDFTGGVSELWNLTTGTPDIWFPKLRKLVDGNFPAIATMKKQIAEVPQGAIGLASIVIFTLKNIATVEYEENRSVRLIRLGDPCGTIKRYTGNWNDDAPEWRKVPQYMRDKLVPKRDGGDNPSEFWMTYADFCTLISSVQFCVLTPQDMGPVSSSVKWTVTSYKGQFPKFIPTVSNIRQSGSTIYEIYPQYQIELTDVDDYEQDQNCELLVSLLQKEAIGAQKMILGFALFPMKNPKLPLPLKGDFFNTSTPSFLSPVHNWREITCRLRLNPGFYVLVVLTSPNFKRREFLLRIYKHQRFKV